MLNVRISDGVPSTVHSRKSPLYMREAAPPLELKILLRNLENS